VLRGGSFDNSPENLRSANRDDDQPEDRNQNNGFRCARVSPPNMRPRHRLQPRTGPHAAPVGTDRSRTPGPPVPV